MAVQNNLSSRLLKNPWVVTALALFVATVVLSVVFATALTDRARQHRRIGRLEAEILKREKSARENEKVDRLIKSISVVDREETRLSPALSFLVAAADVSGTSLGKIEFGEWRQREEYDEADLQFTVLGSYDRIGWFVNYMERKKPTILMHGLSITRVENGLKATIKGSVLVLH